MMENSVQQKNSPGRDFANDKVKSKMLWNKKAQSGHILSAPIVFILVALVMLGFVAIAAGIAILHKPAPPQISKASSPLSSLSLKEVSLENTSYLIYDLVYLRLSGKVNEDDFKKYLLSLRLKENECYYLSYNTYSSYVLIPHEYSNIMNKPEHNSFKERIKNKILTVKIKVNGNSEDIREYFGSCQ